jgi:hypothetical protein
VGGFTETVKTTPPGKAPKKKLSDEMIPPPPPGFEVQESAPTDIPPPPSGFSVGDEEAPLPKKQGMISRALQSFSEAIGAPGELSDIVTGPATMIRHPLRSIKDLVMGMAEPQQKLIDRAYREQQSPRLLDKIAGLIHGTEAAIPFVGPVLEKAGEEMKEGNIAGAVGSTVGAAAPFLAGGKASPMEAARGIRTGIRERVQAVRQGQGVTGKTLAAVKPFPMKKEMLSTPAIGEVVPSEGIPRIEVNEAAKARGINMTAAEATGSRPLQSIQGAGERSIVGGGKLQSAKERNIANVIKWTEDVGAKIDPENRGLTNEQVGSHLGEAAEVSMDNMRKGVREQFAAFKDAFSRIKADTSEIAKKYSSHLQELHNVLNNLPEAYASPIRNLLNKASKMGTPESEKVTVMGEQWTPEELWAKQPKMAEELGLPKPGEGGGLNLHELSMLRSAFWDIGHKWRKGNIPDYAAGLARELTHDTDLLMMETTKAAGADVEGPFRQANAAYELMKNTFDDPKSPMYQVLAEPDPSKIPQKVLAAGNFGGSPQNIRTLKNLGIDLAPIKRQILGKLLERNFDTSKRTLSGYSHEFLSELYTPEELREIYILAKVGRTIGFDVNPPEPGKSSIGGILWQLGALGRGALHIPGIEWAAGKFTSSPSIRRWLTGVPPGKGGAPSLREALAPRGGGGEGPAGARMGGPPPPPETPPAPEAPKPLTSEAPPSMGRRGFLKTAVGAAVTGPEIAKQGLREAVGLAKPIETITATIPSEFVPSWYDAVNGLATKLKGKVSGEAIAQFVDDYMMSIEENWQELARYYTLSDAAQWNHNIVKSMSKINSASDMVDLLVDELGDLEGIGENVLRAAAKENPVKYGVEVAKELASRAEAELNPPPPPKRFDIATGKELALREQTTLQKEMTKAKKPTPEGDIKSFRKDFRKSLGERLEPLKGKMGELPPELPEVKPIPKAKSLKSEMSRKAVGAELSKGKSFKEAIKARGKKK